MNQNYNCQIQYPHVYHTLVENSFGREIDLNSPDDNGNTLGAQIIKRTIKMISNAIIHFV